MPIVLDCIKDDEDDERRLTGVILIDELAEVIGAETLRDEILMDFISL